MIYMCYLRLVRKEYQIHSRNRERRMIIVNNDEVNSIDNGNHVVVLPTIMIKTTALVN